MFLLTGQTDSSVVMLKNMNRCVFLFDYGFPNDKNAGPF